MRKLTKINFFFVLLFWIGISFSQTQQPIRIKTKFLGQYKGSIPAYTVNLGDRNQEVKEAAIQFEMGKNDTATETIDNVEKEGEVKYFKIEKSDDILIVFSVEGYAFPIRYRLNPKNSTLKREGFGIQPEVLLKKN